MPASSWLYYGSYLANYGLYAYLLVHINLLYWRSLQRYTNLAYMIRRLVCMLGFIAITCGIVLDLIQYLPVPIATLNVLLEPGSAIALSIGFILVAIGFVLPQTWLIQAIGPLEQYVVYRQQRQYDQIRYLHQKMVQIVPGVHLQNEHLRDVRMLIEISDARQIIWSLVPHEGLITPAEEAEQLFKLIRSQTIIDVPGEYIPQPTQQRNIVKHNIAVTKHLRRLEQS